MKKPNNNSYDGEQSHDDFNAEMRPIAVRFEAMIDTNTNALFEDEELEDLFEYYGYQNKWIRAEQVADFLIENNPYSGEFYVRKAQAALALENTHTAFETLEIAESFDPFNYEIFLVRATAYEFLDEFDQAFADFEHALSLADTEGKGLIYTAMAAAYINQENFQKAKIYFKKALEINPDNIEALNDLCYAYHESEENIALGIDFFEQLTDESPRNELIWFCLATLLKHLGNTVEAVDAFDFALVINENNDQTHYFKGNTYLDADIPKLALPCFEKALKLDPKNYIYHCSVGVCYEKMDKPNVARPYYQATTELAPQAPDGWFGLAICALMTDEHLQAIDYLNKAIALDDTNPDFWYNLGDAYYQADNIPQATDAFVRALAAEPTHLEARIDLAFALSENDDAKAAIELFEKGMDFHSENSEYLYCYAALLIEAGKQQQGYLYLQTALQINYPQYVILLEIAPEILLDPQVVAIIQDNKPE